REPELISIHPRFLSEALNHNPPLRPSDLWVRSLHRSRWRAGNRWHCREGDAGIAQVAGGHHRRRSAPVRLCGAIKRDLAGGGAERLMTPVLQHHLISLTDEGFIVFYSGRCGASALTRSSAKNS
ncbi:hypothetical protein, partial [Rhodoblastus acidophilus]|uniref:hypothetical protein n=1 Tax=Rhodoblastus acidophilus TaxID=1074 RepID=UPI002224D35B